MAELADALDSKSSDGDIVWVRAPPPVPSIFIKRIITTTYTGGDKCKTVKQVYFLAYC